MSDFNKEKLNVIFANDIDKNGPIIPRRYTLTHSDETGELFLSIGKYYDYSKVNDLRDEVLGCWSCDDDNNLYFLRLEVLLDACGGEEKIAIRNKIFRNELPMAIKAIIYGDRELFLSNEELYECKIIINFKSSNPNYHAIEQWGCVKDYKMNDVDKCRYYRQKNNKPMNNLNMANNQENMENFQSMNMEGNLVNYPMPFAPGMQYPPQGGPSGQMGPQNRCWIIERALMDMLFPYIENEVFLSFGKNTPFCLRQGRILNARVISNYGPCRERYEIVVGMKAGRVPPPYDNIIITFLISNNKVTVKSVKNPRLE
ncbi:MAG: DUF3888 domain-containing protein [Clostridium sp.]|nr:DUF3888 domain-containing protein [Clostridium sp.]